jgi:4a-hydroxytetrahydrobiopterin dehydratase
MTIMERRKLTDDEISTALTASAGWTLEAGQITKTYEFPSYLAGVTFVSAIAHLAEAMDHHPDLDLRYRKLRVALNTHDVGGISPLDFELARRIDAIR